MKQFIRIDTGDEYEFLSRPYEQYAETQEEIISMIENLENNKPKNPCKTWKRKLKFYKDKLKTFK